MGARSISRSRLIRNDDQQESRADASASWVVPERSRRFRTRTSLHSPLASHMCRRCENRLLCRPWRKHYDGAEHRLWANFGCGRKKTRSVASVPRGIRQNSPGDKARRSDFFYMYISFKKNSWLFHENNYSDIYIFYAFSIFYKYLFIENYFFILQKKIF